MAAVLYVPQDYAGHVIGRYMRHLNFVERQYDVHVTVCPGIGLQIAELCFSQVFDGVNECGNVKLELERTSQHSSVRLAVDYICGLYAAAIRVGKCSFQQFPHMQAHQPWSDRNKQLDFFEKSGTFIGIPAEPKNFRWSTFPKFGSCSESSKSRFCRGKAVLDHSFKRRSCKMGKIELLVSVRSRLKCLLLAVSTHTSTCFALPCWQSELWYIFLLSYCQRRPRFFVEGELDFTLDLRAVAQTDGSCPGNGKPNARAGIGVYYGDHHPWYVRAL